MGGKFSGRQGGFSVRRTTEYFPMVDIKELKKALNNSEAEIAKLPGAKYLAYTEPHYGGRRYWFSCPDCKGRVTKLYFAQGDRTACRECLGLCYRSQLQQTKWTLLDRARKIHQELGGDGDFGFGMPHKPHRMHRRTYQRKIEKIFELWERSEQISH